MKKIGKILMGIEGRGQVYEGLLYLLYFCLFEIFTIKKFKVTFRKPLHFKR